MSRFKERLDASLRHYNIRLEKFRNNKVTPMQIIILLLVVCYPIGAWVSLWSFSSIAMAVIIILVFHIENIEQDKIMYEGIKLAIVETEHQILDVKVDTDKQLSELLSPNKELLSKVEQFEERTEEQFDALEYYIKDKLDRLATVIQKSNDFQEEHLRRSVARKIDTFTEQLETVIAMKTEAIKTTIASKAKTIETTIHEKSDTDNIEALGSLESVVEQFEGLAGKNEELYSLYEPLLEQVNEVTEELEYGNLFNEQIRLLMKNNTELINKNESLTEEVEQLLSYYRNK